MPNNDSKRCPQCGGAIDYFGSCRRCGREWSPTLEEEETAEGLPDGQQHPAEIKPPTKKTTRTRHTKNSSASNPNDKYLQWQIGDYDDNMEIIRKRSLMRVDSRKTYNAMGLALRAHESEKGALLWLSRLWAFLSEEEQVALTPALEHLKRSFADIKLVAQRKINEAAKMEIEMDKAHKSARKARIRIMSAEAKQRAKEAAQNEMPKPGQDSEGYGLPDPAMLSLEALEQLTHEELLELAKAKLSNLDQEKFLRKRGEHLINDDPDE